MKDAVSQNNKGFSLLEALFAISILFFVVVSVIGAFASQLRTNRNQVDYKAIAMEIAESQMETILKNPSSQILSMVAPTFWRFQNNYKLVQSVMPPDTKDHLRSSYTLEWEGNLRWIIVRVDYGAKGRATEYGNDYYSHITLRTCRGGGG